MYIYVMLFDSIMYSEVMQPTNLYMTVREGAQLRALKSSFGESDVEG